MTQKRNYKQYPKEFKEEAVALITEQGYTVAKAAEALGVATNMLYRWKENAEKQKAGISLSEDERTELKGLRQEVELWSNLVFANMIRRHSFDLRSSSHLCHQ